MLSYFDQLVIRHDMEPEPKGTVRSRKQMHQNNEKQLQRFSEDLLREAQRLGLDDYGIFRLVVHSVDRLPIRTEKYGPLSTVATAISRGRWGQSGRCFALSALLRNLGYGAVVGAVNSEQMIVGIPVLR